MTHSQILLIRIRKEIQIELSHLDRLENEYKELPDDDAASYLIRAKASIFHDFYTGVERIFVKLAQELNGGVPKTDQWHKELLFQMTLELEDVRPPVVSTDLFTQLEHFLRFRHLFRNVYGFDLSKEKLMELESCFEPVNSAFRKQIGVFLQWLAQCVADEDSLENRHSR